MQTTFSYQYDDSGLVTVYSMYDGLGTLIDQEFYLYNASGLLQQSIDIDGNITDYGYSNGVLSSITFTFDGQSTTTAFTYDDLNILQSTTYTSMQTLVGTLSQTYEEDGLQRLDNLRLITESQTTRYTYAYVGETSRIANVTINIGDNASLEHVISYQYDELGNITQIVYAELGVEVLQFNYEYDTLNRLVKEHIYRDDDSCSLESDTCYSTLYIYDSLGNILGSLRYIYNQIPVISSGPAFLYDDDSLIPVDVYWYQTYQPNEIYFLKKNTNPIFAFTFVNPVNGTSYNDVTVTRVTNGLDITQSGYQYQTYHAWSPSGIDVTFNIVFFVGAFYYTTTYEYSNEWLNQLEAYAIMNDGITTTHRYSPYDEQGNPLEQTEFAYAGITYHHAEFEWSGRQLTAIVIKRANDSIVATIEYQYNDQGYRTQKVITEGTSIYTYEYELHGSCVIRETLTKTVNGLRTESYELIFLYDVNNTHIGFLLDGIEYFYLTDLLGNIISILAEDGTEMVKYEYDAYGNIINSPTGTLSTINPYTYRGYRYDTEIDMYYLNSRYYNPETGRFISSDGLLGETDDIQSTNMYAYCANNPIANVDPTGFWVMSLFGFTITYGAFGGGFVSVWWLFDGKGNQGILITCGVGFYLPGVSLSYSPFFSWKKTIFDLQGITYVAGGGFSGITSFGCDILIDKKGVLGIQLNLGIGVGMPIDVHGAYCVTALIPLKGLYSLIWIKQNLNRIISEIRRVLS
ncbi:MAG: RHS repeat-associated core domain-containing protein [Candidatus Izemoplasmatales bacterium]